MADLTPAAEPPEAMDLRQRSAAERCLYLAAKLSEHGDGDPLAVALVLEILGAEIRAVSERATRLMEEWNQGRQVFCGSDAGRRWLSAVLELLLEVSRSSGTGGEDETPGPMGWGAWRKAPDCARCGDRGRYRENNVEAHCTCKRGRRMSELWYAEKHGFSHPDEPEPDPAEYDEAPF